MQEMVARLMLHPRFPEAVAHLSERFFARHQGQPVFNKLCSDEGRFLVSQFAVSLHMQPEGATPGRIRALCLATGIISHGRVDATLDLLRHSGRLLDGPPDADRRRRPLLASALMLEEFRTRTHDYFVALEMLEPGSGFAERVLRDAMFHGAIERLRGELVAAVPSLRVRLPALEAIAHVDGGYHALMALMAWCQGQPGPVEASPGRLAQCWGFSRSQMRRALEALEREGLVARRGEAIQVLPALPRMMATWHAIRLLRHRGLAQRAAHELARAA